MNGCRDCKWADCQKTPSGRLKMDKPIFCRYPPPDVSALLLAMNPCPIPASMRQPLETWSLYAYGMWDSEKGVAGHDCPCWEPKE